MSVIEHVHSSEDTQGSTHGTCDVHHSSDQSLIRNSSFAVYKLFVSVTVAAVLSHCALCRIQREVQLHLVILHLISYTFKHSYSAKHSLMDQMAWAAFPKSIISLSTS